MNKNIEKLIKLVQENPELEVIPSVDSDVCEDCYDRRGVYRGSIEYVEKTMMFSDGECVLWDEEYIRDHFYEHIEAELDYRVPEEEKEKQKIVDRIYAEKLKSKEIREIICIQIGLP